MRVCMPGVIVIGLWSFGVFVDGALAQNSVPAKKPAAQARPLKSNLQKATGRVLDKKGKPVAGAQLCIRSVVESKTVLMTTDKVGRFSADVPVGDSYRNWVFVKIVHPQHGLAGGILKSGDNEFRFVETKSIGGRVLNKEGKPVEGVAISLSEWSGANGKGYVSLNERGSITLRDSKEFAALISKYTVRSDAQGNWKMHGVPREGNLLLLLLDPRFVRMVQSIKTDAPASESQKINFLARPGAYITGRVVDEKKKPVAGVRLFANGLTLRSMVLSPDGQ